ncbi:MAG: hypothetical protein EAZ09_08305 [Oscillatoriales cyanobacterium]|nr:MAG: hypothetical protein EAZ18_07340 [Oscillatoriales cyanobacterium]TAH23159.1 MAG: hypothetical protein EAZ09_08305 [Oscillatoriales cyanobacterium]
MNRRKLLKLGFFTTVSWFFLELSAKACTSNRVFSQLYQKLLNLQEVKNFQVIGERYIELYPEESQLKYLVARLNDLMVIAEDEQRGIEWEQWLQAKIKEDFQLGQTVQIDGWIFAKTEAQLCALATHLSGSYPRRGW